MAELPPYPDSSEDTGVGPDREVPTGTPRWLKAFGIIVIIVALLLIILLLRGGHGPGRHLPPGGAGGDTPPSRVLADHTPPREHGVYQP